MSIDRRDYHVLGKRAVTIGSQVQRFESARRWTRPQYRIDENALSAAGRLDVAADGHNITARVRALNEGKRDRAPRPARIVRSRLRLRGARGASAVSARGEYQPMRRLMSVLLIPAALTRTSTSSGCGCGTGTSHRYSSRSRSPCPVSKTALMQEGKVDINLSETL